MTTRVLPVEEWPRLAALPLGAALAHLTPETCRVLVVEDPAGTILGCWALLSVLHVEGIWIAEGERRRGAVQRRLMRGMRDLVRAVGARSVWTAAETTTVADLIARLGGVPVEAPSFVVPLVQE